MRLTRTIGRLTLLAAGIAGIDACTSFDGSEPGGVAEEGADGGFVADADADAVADGPTAWVPCADREEHPAHFCDDFDHAGVVDLKWLQRVESAGGTIDSSEEAKSPPRALTARLPAGLEGGAAVLLRDTGDLEVSTTSSIAYSFAMRVDAQPYSAEGRGFVHVAVLTFDTPDCPTSGGRAQRGLELSFEPSGNFRLFIKGFKGTCEEDGGTGNDFQSLLMPFGIDYFSSDAFRDVTLEVTRGSCPGTAGAARVRVLVDGARSACQSLVVDPFERANPLTARLGLLAGGSFAETQITYDNVTLDFD